MLALRAAAPELELLVYVDAASDGTATILREYEDRLRLVVSPARHGKTHGMNTLVGMTSAEVVVFSDANVIFAPDAVPKLVAPFADAEVGAVCGHLRYVGDVDSGTAESGSLYWRLEEHIKALESETGSVMGADGSIFAIRRSLHRPPPPDLIDDMFVSFSVLCDGSRIVRADDAVAFEEAVSRPGEEFRRKVRIACQAFNVHRALWPRLKALPAMDGGLSARGRRGLHARRSGAARGAAAGGRAADRGWAGAGDGDAGEGRPAGDAARRAGGVHRDRPGRVALAARRPVPDLESTRLGPGSARCAHRTAAIAEARHARRDDRPVAVHPAL
jgi:hypothetical protein